MDIQTLDQLEDKYIGKKGTAQRDSYEKDIVDLMIGAFYRPTGEFTRGS